MFTDRADAGTRLASALHHLADRPAVVLGLARGGVPVAYEVARSLGAPLDAIVVRKIGVPFQPELAMGAVGEGGVRVVDRQIMALAQVSAPAFATAEAAAREAARKMAVRLRAGRPPVPLDGRTALVVDDGLATGCTARAACGVARARGAARVVLAVPVAAGGAVARMRQEFDDVIALSVPADFGSVGEWYDDFGPVSDEDVLDLLRRASTAAPDGPPEREIEIRAGAARLAGTLSVPPSAQGLVIFAHGSGSSRFSPRNQDVASTMNAAGLATLLFDLLAADEAPSRRLVFDVPLLGSRLAEVTEAVRGHFAWISYFGASTGSAAALWAAAEPSSEVASVVSRGGRPDLVGDRLGRVRAPTLLLVGGNDDVVLDLNRQAQRRLTCPNDLVVVPGAGHLFEEPGALAIVAHRARDWFLSHAARTVPRGG